MWLSIQDYCKKINRKITITDIVSLSVTVVFLLGCVVFLSLAEKKSAHKVVYKEADGALDDVQALTSSYVSPTGAPFGSKKGKTYTFSWCRGSGTILDKNKIYFSSEEEAKNTGRTLSKLCQK